MKKLLCIFAFTVALYGQASPNCNQINLQVTASGASTNYNNTGQQKCSVFQLKYFSEGFSALSLQVESAPDVAGVPGAFVIVPAANIVQGSNPSTNTVSGVIIVSAYFPWLRVNITSVTGTGFINYNFIGSSYIAPPTPTTSSVSTPSTVTAIGPDAAGVAPTQNAVQIAGFDNTNVQRIRTDTNGLLKVQTSGLQTGSDGQPNSAGLSGFISSQIALVPIAPYAFDGATQWNRIRQAGLNSMPVSTTLTGRNSIGVPLGEKGSRWTVVSNPASGSQATASIASEASVRHIVDCVSFSAAATTAPAATALTINVRDGATGAGTIIWTWQTVVTATTGQLVQPHSVCGLALVGTSATAMTAEFSAALANLIESVSISGYNVN